LREDERYSESDLEDAIIRKIEHFMLELGKKVLFERRQSGSLLMATVSSLTCLVRIQPSQLLWGNKQEQ